VIEERRGIGLGSRRQKGEGSSHGLEEVLEGGWARAEAIRGGLEHSHCQEPGLGLGVWGLEFRVSGVGCGVQGVGFRI